MNDPLDTAIRRANVRIAGATRRGDSAAEREARQHQAAAKLDKAVTRTLVAAGVPLKREDAENLAARIRGAAER